MPFRMQFMWNTRLLMDQWLTRYLTLRKTMNHWRNHERTTKTGILITKEQINNERQETQNIQYNIDAIKHVCKLSKSNILEHYWGFFWNKNLCSLKKSIFSLFLGATATIWIFCLKTNKILNPNPIERY